MFDPWRQSKLNQAQTRLREYQVPSRDTSLEDLKRLSGISEQARNISVIAPNRRGTVLPSITEVNSDHELELTISDRFINYFTRRGYKVLGDGRDQIAFETPRGTVLKIVGHGSPYRQQLIEDYVDFFKRNQRNPYYPNIYNTNHFEYDGEAYFLYETEYLEYVSGEEAVLGYIEDLMRSMNTAHPEAFIQNRPRPPGLSEDVVRGLVNATEDIVEYLIVPKGYSLNNLDLVNIENIRRRSNGQLVIVDPLSEWDL